jgi:hypothetical protein
MDFLSLSAGAIAFVAPYLAEGGKEMAKRAGGAVWEKVLSLHRFIGSSLAQDMDSAAILENFERTPGSSSGQAALAEAVSEKLRSNPALANELNRLLREPSTEPAPSIVQSVSISGEAGNVSQIGTVGGSVTIRSGRN